MRRPGPRSLTRALDRVVRDAAPATTLARAQGVWAEAVGPQVAAEAEPVAEHEGQLTVACRSSVWAQELQLLGAGLLERLNAHLGGDGAAPSVRALRFVVRDARGPAGRRSRGRR